MAANSSNREIGIMPRTFFNIGKHDKNGNIASQIHRHHPLKGMMPDTTFKLPSSCHAVVSAWQREKPTKLNIEYLRNFILALSVEWFLMESNREEND